MKELKIYDGGDLAANLNACGVPCAFKKTLITPAAVMYEFKATAPQSFEERKARRAVARLSLIISDKASYAPALGGFTVIIPRPEHLRTFPHFSQFSTALSAFNGAAVIPLGVDDAGEYKALPLVNCPHVLVAGASGSGKSVFLHNAIAALSAHSSNAQLVLIDLKIVEFNKWRGLIPLNRLAAPIISTPHAAWHYLAACVDEMERRYKLLAAQGLRDNSAATFPPLVIIIDELSDLMLQNKNATELPLIRLAQKGRAAGIHLILATQRPTVNVVTGLLKANISTRVCFAVPTYRDSMVVLDVRGAEKLRGKGDALVLLPDGTRAHVQAPFLSDADINTIAPPPPPAQPIESRANPLKKLLNALRDLFTAADNKSRKNGKSGRDDLFLCDIDCSLDD